MYNSTDIGGDVYAGRFMETCTTAGGAVLAGTTLHAQSRDGALGLSGAGPWADGCEVGSADFGKSKHS